MNKIFYLAISCIISLSLHSQTPSFIFKSGFEGSSELIQYYLNGKPNPNNADIVGIDRGYDWVQDLDKNSNIGSFRIYYEKGDTAKSIAKISIDPMDANNHVLSYQIKAPHITYTKAGRILQKGRIQVGINGNPDLKHFSTQQKLLIHPDFVHLKKTPLPINWLTIQEFWNNSPAKPFPFRVTVNIRKAAGIDKELYFGAHAQTKENEQWRTIWDTIDSTYPVPLGTWFTMKTDFVEGDANKGKFTVTLTNSKGIQHKIVDITGYTHHPDDPNPDGVTNFNPMKLYTSSELIKRMNSINECLCLYWDDFELQTFPLITDTKNYSAEDDVRIYPNPVQSILFIDAEKPLQQAYIYNAIGQPVHRSTIIKNQTLDVSSLKQGIYYLKINYADNQSASLRFIKQ